MPDQKAQSKVARSPIVVVMGHVDHGKTKILDSIRQSNVMDKESGGITQHIGAYQAKANGKTITFLDTPGHEAFSAIRSRGAKVADLAILVVAADESVKPQTKEAIKIIQEAQIPFIVAINKTDKEGANPAKVRQDLATENVLVEDWGGKVPVVELSAKTGKNIPELLEMILLVAELEELTDDQTLPAQGVIIESSLDRQRGYVATALVHKGILKAGDWIVVGTVVGKIKLMEDFTGKVISQAVPSQPVLITGWPAAPDIGRSFESSYSKSEAEDLRSDNVDFTSLFHFLKDPGVSSEKKYLNFVFKSDVTSSLEALDSALKTIKSEEVGYRVVAYDIGNINESDVKTAIATKSQIFGFRVGIEPSAKKLAEKENISIQTFDVIYELIESIRKGIGSLLEPEVNRVVLGKLKVLAVFKQDAKSQIIGGRVMNGKMVRGCFVDAVQGDVLTPIGKLAQLQQNKEDTSEVKEGNEAGLKIDSSKGSYQIKEGDTLEVYEEEKKERWI